MGTHNLAECCFVILPLCYWLAWIGMLSYLIYFNKRIGGGNDAVDLSYLYQVSDEWKT
jgi:hypothetical protein